MYVLMGFGWLCDRFTSFFLRLLLLLLEGEKLSIRFWVGQEERWKEKLPSS